MNSVPIHPILRPLAKLILLVIKTCFMKMNKILLAILLLIIVCQTKNILEPEIRKILADKQSLPEVITTLGNTISVLKKKGN